MASAIPETPKREQYVYMARLAKRTERYEDMVKYMEKLVIENSTPGVTELTVEERNLLTVAYKNLIGPLRAAWRNFKSMEQKEEKYKNKERMSLVKDYRLKVESDLNVACGGILKLLESHLVPSASTSESKVYYLKLKGDYHRYMAEFKVGEERKAATDDTMSCYKAAQDIAHTDLVPMHPIRVALALNISVFLCEFLGSSKKACETAKQVPFDEPHCLVLDVGFVSDLSLKLRTVTLWRITTSHFTSYLASAFVIYLFINLNQAFREAIDEFGTVGEESDKDNPLYMKLLKDFFKLWISDAQEYYGV